MVASIQVVGAVTKAAVGVAVGRAAATVTEEQGTSPRLTRETNAAQQRGKGAKKKAFIGLLKNLITFLKSDGSTATNSNAHEVG